MIAILAASEMTMNMAKCTNFFTELLVHLASSLFVFFIFQDWVAVPSQRKAVNICPRFLALRSLA